MKNGKRRGATKVPNVILRPAPSTTHPKEPVASTSNTEEDEGTNNVGELYFREGSLPLHGVVLCATGRLDKVTLFAYAQQLGATRSNDFTDKVTHLIADAPGSSKYQCAVQRNLPILGGSWIEAIYNAWLRGETIDLKQYIAEHRLPIFSGVRLCITGMQDIETRERIATIIEEQGGVYSKSLGPLSTHLLCSDTVSDKVAWAKRINQERGMRKINIIWEEWFWDCLEFGGRWDEEPYFIDMPRPTRKLVETESRKLNKQVTILPSDSQVNSLPRSPPSYLPGEDDAPELGQTQKQKGIGLRILRNIIHTRNFSQNEKKDPQIEPASVPAISVDASKPTETTTGVSSNLQQGRNSVLERLSDSRKDSLFAAASPSQAIPLSLRCASDTDTAVSATRSISKQSLSDITLNNIFAGYSFRALGEAKEGAMLRDAINRHGGRWLSDDDVYIDPDFLLVRLVGGNTFWNGVSPAHRSKFRTECWVERSIFEERMCAVDEHITFTPLDVTVPVEGSEKLFVSLSGLDSAETHLTKRLLRAVGANVQSAFSKSTSHLICPSGHGEKFQKAQEWKIPVVNLEWLFFIARKGKVPIHRDFEVKKDNSQSIIRGLQDAMFLSETKDEQAIELEADGREEKIIDITNNHSQETEPRRPADPSLRLEETSSMTDCPTASYHEFIPAPTNFMSSFSPNGTESGMELTFGEPLGLRVPGSPEANEKNNARGCSMQPSHPSSIQEGSKTCEDVGMKRTPIPSSCSPSPLQINSGSIRTLSPSISETRVLRTAITALLGKRAPELKTDELTVQKRPTKRPRPHCSRSLRGESEMPSLMSLVATSSPLSCLSNKEDNIANEEGSPLGVIYEDPDQRDEKRRLIALFEKSTVISGSADEIIVPAQSNVKHPDEIPETSKRKKSTRRSNRSSGGKG